MIGIEEVEILCPILECSAGIILVVIERKGMCGSVFEALVWLYVWRSFERVRVWKNYMICCEEV